MSGQDLDLDAILAEFHAEEAGKAPAPAPDPAPRRRREEPVTARLEREESVPRDSTTRYEARTERPEPRRVESEEPVPVTSAPDKPAKPRENPKTAAGQNPAADPEKQAAREARAAKRRRTGRVRMAAVLAVLALVLAGLMWWVVREEQKNAVPEPAPIALDLGGELEEYLDYAATHSSGS